MGTVGNLFKEVVVVDKEVAAHDLETSSGSSFINECGIYPVTIKEAFVTKTKKGGVQLDLHFSGNEFMTKIYPVSNKDGKLVTTYEYKGKTNSLADFKLLKQLLFVTNGKPMDLADLNLKEETIKYSAYGKDVEVLAETVLDLKGKEINIGVRLEEKYNYEDGETDKTSLETNQNGDVVYDKKLFSVYAKSGKTPTEIIKKEDAKQIDSDRTFLESDKGIKRVKLEKPENDFEVVAEGFDEKDELDF